MNMSCVYNETQKSLLIKAEHFIQSKDRNYFTKCMALFCSSTAFSELCHYEMTAEQKKYFSKKPSTDGKTCIIKQLQSDVTESIRIKTLSPAIPDSTKMSTIQIFKSQGHVKSYEHPHTSSVRDIMPFPSLISWKEIL